jgi:magnesium transporter
MLQAELQTAFLAEHPPEAAAIFDDFSPADASRLLSGETAGVAGALLYHMTPSHAAAVLQAMPPQTAAAALQALPTQQAAPLLGQLPPEAADALLTRMSRQMARDVRAFLQYGPETVGSLMHLQVLALPADLTVAEALGRVRAWPRRDLHDLYVIDREHVLLGTLSLNELLFMSPAEPLREVMRPELLVLDPLEDRERIVEICNDAYIHTLPVADRDGRLLGVIRARDIFRVGQAEVAADMVMMVGASPEERALSPLGLSVRKRLPWLQVNLFTAFLAAFVVGLFEDTIAQFTALAVLLPVVAGQSGNTGAQSLAVVMRGLVLRDITPRQWLQVGGKELTVSFINGMAVALTTGLAVYVWSRSWGLVLVIMLSMVLSMCMAGFSGAIIPIVLKSLHQDPAQSSSIFLTTVTDIAGFLSFLGLATIFSAFLA